MGCCSFCHNRSYGFLLAVAGLAISGYALYVENKSLEDPTYTPLCDIDEGVSCSVAFNSTYGRGFGLVGQVLGEDHPLNQPNPVYGLAFYSFVALLTLLNFVFTARIQLYLSVLSNVGSLWLGYVLYFVLRNLCVVCAGIYAVNFLLLVASYCKLSYLRRQSEIRSQFSAGPRRSNQGLPTTARDFKKNI